MLITLFAPALNKHITIRLSEQTVKELRARMAIGISLHMFPLETRRVKAKRDWDVKEFKDYNLVYFNNQWHLKDRISANNVLLPYLSNKLSGKTANTIVWDTITEGDI